jgi:hypothetical protein
MFVLMLKGLGTTMMTWEQLCIDPERFGNNDGDHCYEACSRAVHLHVIIYDMKWLAGS